MQAKTKINERIISTSLEKSQRLIAWSGTARQSPCVIKDLNRPAMWRKPQQTPCPGAIPTPWKAFSMELGAATRQRLAGDLGTAKLQRFHPASGRHDV